MGDVNEKISILATEKKKKGKEALQCMLLNVQILQRMHCGWRVLAGKRILQGFRIFVMW